MPKPTRRKESDFLRFRPYHAFTTAADRTRENGRKVMLRIVWVAGIILLIFIAATQMHIQ
jgi:hypothetical protein